MKTRKGKGKERIEKRKKVEEEREIIGGGTDERTVSWGKKTGKRALK